MTQVQLDKERSINYITSNAQFSLNQQRRAWRGANDCWFYKKL